MKFLCCLIAVAFISYTDVVAQLMPTKISDLEHDLFFEKRRAELDKITDQQHNRTSFESSESNSGLADTLLLRFLRKASAEKSTVIPSPAGALTWTEIGPQNMGGRTRAFLSRHNGNKLECWAASTSGGIWYNPDFLSANSSFSQLVTRNLVVSSMALSPTDPSLICYGTGEANISSLYQDGKGQGVFLLKNNSVDENISPGVGAYYGPPGCLTAFWYISKVVIDASGAIWAGTWEGLYYLPANSKGWQKISYFGSKKIYDIEINPGSIYVAANRLIARRKTGEPNWTPLITPATTNYLFSRSELAVYKGNPSTAYAVLTDTSSVKGMYKTTDFGDHWTEMRVPIDTTSGQTSDFTSTYPWHCLALEVSPKNPDQLYAGGMNLFKYDAASQGWHKLSRWNNYTGNVCGTYDTKLQYVHADQHGIFFDSADPDLAMFINDGGIFYTKESRAFMPKILENNRGYNVGQLYSCATAPQGNRFVTGTQDNGSFLINGGVSKLANEAGDGGYCFISSVNPKRVITSYGSGAYYVSDDSGNTYRCLTIPYESSAFPNPTVFDEVTENLFTSLRGGFIARSRQLSDAPGDITWVKVPLATGEDISCLKQSIDRNRLYIGTNRGNVWIYDNLQVFDANGFRLVTPGLRPWRQAYVSSIAEDPDFKNKIMISFSSYGIRDKVWACNNVAVAAPVWYSITGDLYNYDIPVRYILSIPAGINPKIKIVVGTEIGVFTSDRIDRSMRWDYNQVNLPKVRTEMMTFRPSDNLLVVATYGRGLFSTRLSAPLTPLAAELIDFAESVQKYQHESGTKVVFLPTENRLYFPDRSTISVDQKIRNGFRTQIRALEMRNKSLLLNGLKGGEYQMKMTPHANQLLNNNILKIQD